MIFLCKKVDFLCCTHRKIAFMHSPVQNRPNLVFSAQESAVFTNDKKIPYFLDTCGDHRYNFTVDTLLIYYVKALKW